MNHQNRKITANELSIEAFELNKKYSMDKFLGEFVALFSQFNCDKARMYNFIRNPFEFIEEFQHIVDSISDKDVKALTIEYKNIKDKYKFDQYLEEGKLIRNKFLSHKKDYLYKTLKFNTVACNHTGNPVLDKVADEISEEYLLSRWLYSVIKKTTTETNGKYIKIKYEDLDGQIKEVKAVHKDYILDPEFIECPLIDRTFGISIFDSFLLNSVYDKTTQKWIYIPIKLIQQIGDDRSDDITEDYGPKDDYDIGEIEPPPNPEGEGDE